MRYLLLLALSYCTCLHLLNTLFLHHLELRLLLQHYVVCHHKFLYMGLLLNLYFHYLLLLHKLLFLMCNLLFLLLLLLSLLSLPLFPDLLLLYFHLNLQLQYWYLKMLCLYLLYSHLL